VRKLSFWTSYVLGSAPWDTGITPPEIVHLVEEEKLAIGRALDLGCGTGTNAVYLAQHGWQVIGIDYVGRAIRRARRKARQAGVNTQTRFITGDVTRLPDLNLGASFDLAVDVGCGHSLKPDLLSAYARSLAQALKPGGIYLAYMFRPTPNQTMGFEPEAVRQLFEPEFMLTWSSLGQDASAEAGSAWYRFTRSTDHPSP
jgi:SAM-dependent methyltransferase